LLTTSIQITRLSLRPDPAATTTANLNPAASHRAWCRTIIRAGVGSRRRKPVTKRVALRLASTSCSSVASASAPRQPAVPPAPSRTPGAVRQRVISKRLEAPEAVGAAHHDEVTPCQQGSAHRSSLSERSQR
jgi:hypothetical protein